MGRPRGFDERDVVDSAAGLFVRLGYEATSVDDLVAATGLHRGSLYKAFGSKRGLFVTALRSTVEGLGVGQAPSETPPAALDLLIVAALELAPRDAEVLDLIARACRELGEHASLQSPRTVAEVLGRRLLERAGLPGAEAVTTSAPSPIREGNA